MVDVKAIEAPNASIEVIYVVIVNVTRKLIKGHGANVLKWKGYELWDVRTHQQMVEQMEALVDEQIDPDQVEKNSDLENPETWRFGMMR